MAISIASQMKAIPIEAEIARRGVRLRRAGQELVGPCPICGGTDRFAVNVIKRVWNCRGCRKGGDIIDLVQHLDGVGFAKAIEVLNEGNVAPPSPHYSKRGNDYEQRQHRKAKLLWSQRRPITGSVAERYLREARGVGGGFPATLGFLPPLRSEHHPALIAAVGIPDEPAPGVLGEPRAVNSVQLTLLAVDGSGKANVGRPKIFIG